MGKRPTTPRAGTAKTQSEPTLVGSLLVGARSTAARRANVALDSEAWREVVGDRIAKRTRPGALRDGELTIYSESPVWAQELSLLSDEIVARLQARGIAVKSIRFRAGSVRRPEPQQPAARPPPPPPKLPEDVRKHLEKIDDPELRDTIAVAAAHSLAHCEKREADAARTLAKRTRAARALRSAGRENVRSDRAEERPNAGPRRKREER